MDKIGYVETERGKGPRGDYYDWCELLDNDTLVFGNEQGNYAGGPVLSYRWYGDKPNTQYPIDHVPSDEYWKEVARTLGYWQKNDGAFYSKIFEMCRKNNSRVFDKVCEIIENHTD